MRIGKKRRHDDRGASAVEFALVVPLLLLIVFGMVEFGVAISRYASVTNAAREGVRAASLGATTDEIRQTVAASLDSVDPDDLSVVVTCQTVTPPITDCGGGGYDTSRTPGMTAVVTVSYPYDWITIVGLTISDHLTLSKTSQMRIE